MNYSKYMHAQNKHIRIRTPIHVAHMHASRTHILSALVASALELATTSLPLDVENASRDSIREGKQSLQYQWGFGTEKTHMCADLATLAAKRLIAVCYCRTNLCRSSNYHWDRCRFDEIMGVRHCAEISGIKSQHITQNGSHHTPHTTPS